MDRKRFLKRAAAVPLVAMIPPSAFAEDSPMGFLPSEMHEIPKIPYPSSLSIENVVVIGFKNAILGYQHVYPTLARAIENMSPAISTKIEWFVLSRRGGNFMGETEFNYTQIIRTPFSQTSTELASKLYSKGDRFAKLRLERLHQHLADVEHTLRYGKRSEGYSGHFSDGTLIRSPLRTCGGLCEFKPGKPKLRVLRDLVLLQNRQPMDADLYSEEFLSEFSLQVS